MAGLGLVFGLVASLSFSAFKPWMDELFQSNPQKVTIPEEEEEEDEATPEDEPEATQQVLDAESYRQMQQSLTSVAPRPTNRWWRSPEPRAIRTG